MKSNSTLGERMKSYEHVNRNYLMPNMPTIIRLDGKAFHSFTKGMERPFDLTLMAAMDETAKYLCENIMGCKVAYTQSDEITLLLTDFDTINTEPWFAGNIQKIVSVVSSMATAAFNRAFNLLAYQWSVITPGGTIYDSKVGTAMFDARVFQLPVNEVVNNFIWRQQDATRNSVQLVGQAHFSHKELHKKSCNDIQDMLMEVHNENWNDYSTSCKRGRCVVKETYEVDDTTRSRWVVDEEIPIFTKDRNYIDKLMKFD